MNFRILLIVALVLIITSCSKTNKEGKFIPNNASMVLHVNGKSLSAKLPWNEVKQNPFFSAIYRDSSLSANMKLLMNNPDSSGIDGSNDLLFFAQKDSTESYIAFEGNIKNICCAYPTSTINIVTIKSTAVFLFNKRTTKGHSK